MARSYPIISADAHLQIASERWTGRVPAKYQYLAPRTVRLEDGTDATVVADGRPRICSGGFTGLPYEKRTLRLGRYDTTPGLGSPEQRLREQDLDGVAGEVLFNFPTPDTYRGIKEKDVGAFRAVIHAWNEFLAEEYCPVAPNRLVAMGLMPDSGIEDALAELEYCARAGLKGVCLTRYPAGEEFPTPGDDRFWAAALDLDMPLSVHVAFSNNRSGAAPFPEHPDAEELVAGIDAYSKLTKYGFRGAGNAVQMVMDGVFERFPRLRMYFAETQVGWIPNFFDQLDDQYSRIIPWTAPLLGMKKLDRLPSEYVREHCWWGFIRNPVGVRLRHEIGVDRMMWSSDFPHAETDWPESQQVIEEMFAGVPDDERYRILAGNVIEYFHVDASPPDPVGESSAVAATH
jgi:predicted TIM-barrel fold metal-dependent hydrolase